MLKFERLLLILNLIRSRPGIKSAELARETGMSQRTIYRDILNVASQYPVLYDKGYRMLPTAYLKTMNLTQSEYSLLQMVLSCPALQRSDLKSRVRTLKGKIDTVVDPAIRKFGAGVNHNCWGSAPEGPSQPQLQKTFTTLEKAIEQKRIVELIRSDNGDRSKAQFYPYALAYRPFDWYVIGFFPAQDDFEGLRVELLKQISPLNKTFIKNEDFNLENFLRSRWGMKGGEETVVKVRFTGQAAQEILASQHHPQEKVVQVGDGEAQYALTVQGTEEILKWILSFGPEAEVLAPASLREEVKAGLLKLREIYSPRENLKSKSCPAVPVGVAE